MLRCIAAAALIVGSSVSWSSSALAQNKGAAGSPISLSGKVDGVFPGQGLLVDSGGKKYAVYFNNTSKITMAGNASPDVLKPGMFVQFTVNFNAEGKPEGEATKIQITEPSAINVPGIGSEKGPDAKPGEPGPYFVRGTVRSYRDGSLAVVAGSKTVTVKVGAGASIPVTVSDWTLASPGDTISGDATAGPANAQGPTPALGTRIEIKAVQPITGKKKGRR